MSRSFHIYSDPYCETSLCNATAVLCGTLILRYVVLLLLDGSLSLHNMVLTLRNDVLIELKIE